MIAKMKKFCEIMVIAYMILFIPATIMAASFDLYGQIGTEYVNGVLVSTVSFVVKLMRLVLFAASGVFYARQKNEKQNIYFYLFMVPVAVFI